MRDDSLRNSAPTLPSHRPSGSIEEHSSSHRDNHVSSSFPVHDCTVHQYTAGLSHREEAAHPLNIGFWIEIGADWRKVFAAVSIPEYMETWMEFSGPTGVDHWVHLDSNDLVCISMLEAGSTVRVCRLRMQCKAKNVSFLCETLEPQTIQTSKVEIVVKGGPRRCSLRLQHSGISDLQDKKRYAAIWRRSLEKLQRLLQ